MPTAPFPHRYVVTLANGQLAAPLRTTIETGPPPQFGGNEEVWSPEELLVGAALACLQSTFAAYAKRAALRIHGWTATGTGTLNKGPGGPVFTSIDLAVELDTERGDEVQAEQVLREAERACIVSRALVVPVHLYVTFASPSTRATA